MVSGYERARKREFTVRQMLQRNKHVYNVRRAPPEVAEKLKEQSGQCSHVNASVELKNKTIPAIRRELRKKLAESLASKRKEKAFAKMCGCDDRPRADDLERLAAAYPALDQIDWDADPVESGINVDLWRAWHARHCDKCTPTQVHKDCYFRLIEHFLRTGLEPPEGPAPDDEPNPLQSKSKRHRAYVNKWNKEKRRCRRAFEKWMQESAGLMSGQIDEVPPFFSPLLPVVREKDRWRHRRSGKDYKV